MLGPGGDLTQAKAQVILTFSHPAPWRVEWRTLSSNRTSEPFCKSSEVGTNNLTGQCLLDVGSFRNHSLTILPPPPVTSPWWEGFSTQREVHFRVAERILVAFETLLPVFPETWTRDTERNWTSWTLHSSWKCLWQWPLGLCSVQLAQLYMVARQAASTPFCHFSWRYSKALLWNSFCQIHLELDLCHLSQMRSKWS